MAKVFSFEAGQGNHFGGGVNFMLYQDDSCKLYAEVAVPEEASEDYGYLAMKKALLPLALKHGIGFAYDGQDDALAEDANDGDVYMDTWEEEADDE
jgi:hypothetical protein